MFALLGNEKIPQVHNIGIVGVYMNQFPFDRDRLVSSKDFFTPKPSAFPLFLLTPSPPPPPNQGADQAVFKPRFV